MITHIVMWKFKEFPTQNEKQQAIQRFEDGLKSLLPIIPQIKHMEFHYNAVDNGKNSDAVLLLHFENREDLQTYLTHPEHQKVSAYCKSIRVSRSSVDYEQDSLVK